MKIKTPLLLLVISLTLVGGLTTLSWPVVAQAECANKSAWIDPSVNTKDKPVIINAGECGKPTSVTFKEMDNGTIFNCSTYEPIKLSGVWSWNSLTKDIKIWINGYVKGENCVAYGAGITVPIFTISWSGGSVDEGNTGYTGYTCDRTTDPARPKCIASKYSTQTEYQCSLACQPQAYNISIKSKLTSEPFYPIIYHPELTKISYQPGESIDFQATAVAEGISDIGCANWSWDFGDGTKTGGTSCGGIASKSHVYKQPGVYTVTARIWSDTSPFAYLHYPGFAETYEVVVGQQPILLLDDKPKNGGRFDKEYKSYNVYEGIDFVAEVENSDEINVPYQTACRWFFDFGDPGGLDNEMLANCSINDGEIKSYIASHFYTQPGTYTVTAKFFVNYDPDKTNTEDAVVTKQIKINLAPQCGPNSESVSDPATVFKCLDQNKPVKLAANSFRGWVEENEFLVDNYLLERQYCKDLGYIPADRENVFRFGQIVDLLTASSGNTPIPLAAALVKLTTVSGNNDFQAVGYHSVIALNFINTNGLSGTRAKYRLRILDPNGPTIVNTRCETRQFPVDGRLFKKYSALYCDYRSGEPIATNDTANSVIVDGSLILNPYVATPNIVKVSDLESKKVRQNPVQFLAQDYPLLDNASYEYGQGVCAGWTDFVLRAAYLVDIVGEETGWNWSSFTANIGNWPWVGLLRGFMR
ncbi:MAG: hypothetical protein A2114_00120 [Candidatus Vogelbacteria bacterium GWA1_51_14]|uniref:PKD domain-containing protein n=1 Tax=Candidatus Vogelbacteria bacterium GWA1_51_14 TaxID=1802435 RepID=A0A1G2QAB8_9BACT|nr:MAG: hypothetical protein A2114_00120 [Candidatus Vogelbacteria bacterium GWA1_51_14]